MEESDEAKLCSLEVAIKEKRTVNVPLWAGVGAVVVGGALLCVPHKKSWVSLFLLFLSRIGNLSQGLG